MPSLWRAIPVELETIKNPGGAGTPTGVIVNLSKQVNVKQVTPRRARRRNEPTVLERYEAKVDRTAGPSACHPWTGARTHDGYGMFIHDGENYATRWGYRHYVGPLKADEIVRHSCDNPPCQNPRHWLTGSHQDNSDDKVSRGRQHHPEGERNPKARLNSAQVIEMRRRVKDDHSLTRRMLAEEYGVSPITIRDVLVERTWRHLL